MEIEEAIVGLIGPFEELVPAPLRLFRDTIQRWAASTGR